jgi:hypothetical protein
MVFRMNECLTRILLRGSDSRTEAGLRADPPDRSVENELD